MWWPGKPDKSSDSSETSSRPSSASSSLSSHPQQQRQDQPDMPTASSSSSSSPTPPSWEQYYKDPRAWATAGLAVAAALGASAFYRAYLRRVPAADHIPPGWLRKRSLLGRVTSVGDGDNFRMYHTPGGRLAGWGWLRRVPTDRKELQGKTIPVRIAGIDAPEGAHFGRPAQPYAAEALAFLTSYLLGRRVRARIYRRDQYERVVATVWVRRPPFFLRRRDVGLEMLRRGLATTYEARFGAEFGGSRTEAVYRAAEARAKAKGRGMWGGGARGSAVVVETPREYKNRMLATGTEKLKEAASAAAAAAATTGGAKGSSGGGKPAR